MADIYNPWMNRGSGGQSPNIAGLDPNFVSTQVTPTWSTGPNPTGTNYLGMSMGSGGGRGPGVKSTTYSGPGGTWKSTAGGTWQNPSGLGPQISDLPGYIRMKGQQQTGANFDPYQNQLNKLMTDPSAIQETPAYKFALEQGNQAISRSAAAKGGLNSGGVLAELAKYGQGMASQEYGGQVNRIADIMRNAQQFGLQSGYYNPATYTPSLGFDSGTAVGRVGAAPPPQQWNLNPAW